MSFSQSMSSSKPTVAAVPTYRRLLSPNELSYFLPSRAYGLNDMFNRLIFRAPPGVISPLRVQIVWAIMRLRHTLMASRFEMEPGCYDDAQFAYTPPANPRASLEEAAAHVRISNDVSGPELLHDFMAGPRTLSNERLSAAQVACHGPVPGSPGLHEYHLITLYHHAINDSLAVASMVDTMLELWAGSPSGTPGGPLRTDAELAKILQDEWTLRWGNARTDDVIVPSTEVRLGLQTNKFFDAAWKVDYENVQRRYVGGHVIPRAKSTTTKPRLGTDPRLISVKFTPAQTVAILRRCKREKVTLQNAIFALCNLAWLRLCAAPASARAAISPAAQADLQRAAPAHLPVMMYTAISIRRYLPPSPSPLGSYMSLALDYVNVVLPGYLPSAGRDADAKAKSSAHKKVLWARAREAQRQMFAYSHSPLLLRRAAVTNKVRGERAKKWAREDDVRDGIVPSPAASAANATTTLIPAVKPAVGGARKAPGGMLWYSRIFLKQLNLALLWETEPYAKGVVEALWREVVEGVGELLLDEFFEDEAAMRRAMAEVEEVDCFKKREGGVRAGGKL
ncbi:hypothetical protein C8R43DRAFT_1029260 [Mycena crocata]|nr:hypothetical protein C8R43DRAFT_1029260 [Mycena crocata]